MVFEYCYVTVTGVNRLLYNKKWEYAYGNKGEEYEINCTKAVLEIND